MQVYKEPVLYRSITGCYSNAGTKVGVVGYIITIDVWDGGSRSKCMVLLYRQSAVQHLHPSSSVASDALMWSLMIPQFAASLCSLNWSQSLHMMGSLYCLTSSQYCFRASGPGRKDQEEWHGHLRYCSKCVTYCPCCFLWATLLSVLPK